MTDPDQRRAGFPHLGPQFGHLGPEGVESPLHCLAELAKMVQDQVVRLLGHGFSLARLSIDRKRGVHALSTKAGAQHFGASFIPIPTSLSAPHKGEGKGAGPVLLMLVA